MKNYSFHEGTPNPSYEYDFEQSLFNLLDHRLLQHEEGWITFTVIHEKHKKIVAAIHFNITGSEAKSPLKSPFGSLEFSESVPAEVIFKFLQFIEVRLKAKGIEKIAIKNPPHLQGGKSALLYTFLFNLGYHVAEAEIGAAISITQADFVSSLNAWEKRRLRQAQDAGLIFRQLDIGRAEEVYDFILKCRQEKEYELSMDSKSLQQAIEKFPERYLLFGIMDHEQLVSASIAIVVTKNVLYNFYADHSKAYDLLSPVVMLVKGIYDYCAEQDIHTLDLGTSALHGKPNFRLLDFKMHLGAQPSMKITVEKSIRR